VDLHGLEQHRRILGILFIVSNALGLLGAVVVGLFFGGLGVLMASSHHDTGEGLAFSALMALGVGGCLLVMSVPGVITGIGLLKRRPWSRVAALVLGILGLPNFPLGTALGAYAIWFYGQQGSDRVFE
jgi:hypothetical protein